MKLYDPDIRKLLYAKFLNIKEFNTDSSTIVVNEMNVCRGLSRVDIAVINGKLHGYEIKSEQDTLERLPLQIDSYNKIFDKMTIVTGEKYLNRVEEIIPEWWGIYYISIDNNEAVLKRKRTAKINKNIDMLELTELLWKDELIKLLNNHGITKGIKSKTRFALSKMAIENISSKNIKNFVKEQLKLRSTWRAVHLQELCGD